MMDVHDQAVDPHPTQRSCDSPPLYAWDVQTLDEALGNPCGVTDDRAAAIENVDRELADAPHGTQGQVRRVALSLSGDVYIDLGVVGEALRTEGGVSWVT